MSPEKRIKMLTLLNELQTLLLDDDSISNTPTAPPALTVPLVPKNEGDAASQNHSLEMLSWDDGAAMAAYQEGLESARKSEYYPWKIEDKR
ncbi:hypothetical protein [Desulfovibrio intestinalis]|uniref:Uncharacterized protein n=1 Tax=Desulfovibrio intestinalis TaxID=58621 RepID=A0A7W8FF77_9BACT|nr:hypothetical protein [Desulfovibrio intestinalis]MBB5142520.1 hypothetical protein [Desulfovibrio intestinalis]